MYPLPSHLPGTSDTAKILFMLDNHLRFSITVHSLKGFGLGVFYLCCFVKTPFDFEVV